MVSRIFHGSAELSAKSQPRGWASGALLGWPDAASGAARARSGTVQWWRPTASRPRRRSLSINTQGAEALSAVHLINCTICIGLSRGFCDKIDLRARAASYNNKIEEVWRA